MVKLRLKRTGRKFEAIYRIVAADSRAPRDGRFIEEIGFYNPQTKEVRINEEAKAKWLADGAVCSETVANLFKKHSEVKAPVKTTKPKAAKKAPATKKATLAKKAE